MNFDFITKPFGWLIMVLYELVKNYGIAVILFSLVVKIILLPFQMKSKRSMMRTSRLQPKLKELEKKHGANKQKYNEEVQKLYKEEKINPMSGCLWSLIPFPIIIALYSAIRQPLTVMMGIAKELIAEGGTIYNKIIELNPANVTALTNVKDAYIQIKQTEFIHLNFSAFQPLSDKLHDINYTFFGMNLGQVPDFQFLWKTTWSDPSIWVPGLLLFLLPIASGVLAFFSSKVSMQMNPAQGNAQQQSSTKTMMLFMPLISVYFGFIMPGAIGVYMVSQTVFSVAQDIWLTKRYTKIMDAEDAVKFEQRRIKEAELEAKRLETERKKLENKMEVNPNTSKKKQLKVERQEQIEKTIGWEKKQTSAEAKAEPSRVDTRRFARGRAYNPERYANDSASDNGQPSEGLLPSADDSESPTETAVYNPEESSIFFESADEQRTEDEEEEE